MDIVLADIRYAIRQLRKSPGFTAVAVITLALGIGANTAIFSVVNAVLLRPLAYRDPDKLVVILHNGRNPVAPANFLDWRALGQSFESMGAAEAASASLLGIDRAEEVAGLHITADILPMLGVQPLLGRVFLPQEQEPGKEHEVILAYSLWQSHFAGDRGIVGKTVTLSGEACTVVGVMPPGFRFAPFWATRAEFWAPLNLAPRLTSRESNSLRVFARLKPGISLQQARAEIGAISARLEQQYPGTNRNVAIVPLKEKVVGTIRPALLVLLGAVGFVLLIACANVAHMLLARASMRHREIAVRAALGAKRSRVVRQFLTESLLLALLGGGAGLLLSVWGTRVLVALSPAAVPRVETITVDRRVLLFAFTASIFTGIAFGLAPALRASSFSLSESLNEAGRGSSEGLQRNRLRGLMVASEFALALMLLAGAGLMIRSFLALQTIDPGFNPHNVLSMLLSVTGTKQAVSDHPAIFYQDVIRDIETLPGVRSVSAINHLPIAGDNWGFPFYVEGHPLPRPGESPTATYRVVLPGYFRTMNIPILQGRDVTESDNPHAPGVVVINAWMARLYWPGEDPIGKRISLDDAQKHPSWLTVVGVVKNTVRTEWAAPPEEEMFLPYLQQPKHYENPSPPFASMTIVVRTAGDPAAYGPAIQSQVWTLDKSVPVSEMQTMDHVVDEATAEPRFYLLLLSAFAAVAVTLAAVGIYGVMSYSVSRRNREIGIRIALGARAGDVVRLVVGQGMVLVGCGLVLGIVGALALSGAMSGLLYGVRSTDPGTFLLVAILLVGVAGAACYVPARRAAKVDPVEALRCE